MVKNAIEQICLVFFLLFDISSPLSHMLLARSAQGKLISAMLSD
jgi:hypothetical protein